MNGKLLWIAVFTVGIFVSRCQETLHAGTDETWVSGGEMAKYVLTVSKGDPASTPDPAVIYNNNPKNDVTATFKIAIEKVAETRREDVSKDVKEVDYTVVISGSESVFVSCNPLYGNFMRSETKYEKKNAGFHGTVSPVIRSYKSGKKTVTLTVKVTMKDVYAEVLTASETIEFTVHGAGIAVYANVGNALTPPTAENNYYYATVNQLGEGSSGGSSGGVTVGHASFMVRAESGLLSSVPSGLSDYVNKSCGYYARDNKLSLLKAIKDWPNSTNSDSPNASGKLVVPDSTDGTSKEFGLTIDQATAALRKIDDVKTTAPEYVLFSNNCVNVCLAVASAAGVNLGDCKYNVVLEDKETQGRRETEATLPNELEKKLK